MTQALLGGLVSGAIYALLGLGIVLVFGVARFVNLAQGEFYVYGALLATTLVAAGLPVWAAALLAVAGVAVLAAVLERLVFSRLADAPHASQLLGGIGVALALAGAARLIWGTDERSLPELVPGPPLELFGARVGTQMLVLFAALALLCLALWLLLHRSLLGVAMRAVAALSGRAGILGVPVRGVTTVAFAVAGAAGAVAGVVVTPLVFVSYQSGLLLTVFGFIAAAFGGLRSIRGAVAGGLLLGVLEAMTAYFLDSALRTPIALSLLVVVLVYRARREGGGLRTRRVRSSERAVLPDVAVPSMLVRLRSRRAAGVGVALVVVFALAGPALLPPYWVSVWSFIGVFVIVGIGLDLLLGYTGQLSLGQTTFTGVSAYLVALSAQWWDVGAGVAVLVAIGGTALLALLLGALVLRLRGYYFTLATLAIAIAAEALVNGLPGLLGGPSGVGVSTTLSLFGFELDTQDRLFAATWIAVALSLVVALRMVRSRFGLGMRAVGHDEQLAAAAGVAPFRVRLAVFVASSVLAAVAGVLYAHILLFVSPPVLGFTAGFDSVVGLLLGGFGTVWGALVGIPIVRLLPELGEDVARYQLLIYGLAVVALVLAMRGGVVGGVRALAARVATRVSGPAPIAVAAAEPAVDVVPDAPSPEPDRPALRAEALSRRFGGLVAVDGVDIAVRPGRIVGLIGPNGAGKSTCLSLLAGSLAADAGTVALGDADVTRLPADARARLGMTRTFQLPRLPADLTVLEVATLGAYRRGRSGPLRGLLTPTAAERAGMARAGRDALQLVGIAHLADAPAGTLSTGQQKLLELARALAGAPRVLLADEPAGGLDGDEVARLGVVLRRVAAGGVAVVLVEHEMDLVMDVCDEIVVLSQGRVIGSGSPADVRGNQEVLDAYLGV
ncbi:ATP-binding cassette domain-containing protein [Pseudonocardia alni]|uniref:ABC transporter permease subunit n=2 Tax=Pseudonocardia alni TaxID=33907 RepID=UPI0036CA0651